MLELLNDDTFDQEVRTTYWRFWVPDNIPSPDEGRGDDGWDYDTNHLAHEVGDHPFHLEDVGARVVCHICGADKFIVGTGSYFTALKCEKCGWELCVHDG